MPCSFRRVQRRWSQEGKEKLCPGAISAPNRGESFPHRSAALRLHRRGPAKRPHSDRRHSRAQPLSDIQLWKTGAPTMPIFVPTPNHDHVVDNSRVNTTPIWWEVRPVLIMDQSDWPAADGSSGITSSKAMDDAEAAGRAIEVGSNFFLFFSSHLSSHGESLSIKWHAGASLLDAGVARFSPSHILCIKTPGRRV